VPELRERYMAPNTQIVQRIQTTSRVFRRQRKHKAAVEMNQRVLKLMEKIPGSIIPKR
jgi:septation ring formation regulator EzrA